MFGRKKNHEEVPVETAPAVADADADEARRSSSDRTLAVTDDNHGALTHNQIKRATRTRYIWALFTSLCLLVSVVFLILVEVGNTSVGKNLNKIYFLKINVSDIIPVSVPDANLINSIAQSLGLHDFYTVGLWNYCEGYTNEGTTSCSSPETLYWFNPVEIIQSQLLAGATSE